MEAKVKTETKRAIIAINGLNNSLTKKNVGLAQKYSSQLNIKQINENVTGYSLCGH